MKEPQPPATPPPDPSHRARPAGSLRTWVTGAVAAAVFGVGGFFAVQALSTHYASATVITGGSGGTGPGGGRFPGGGPGGPGGGPRGAAGFRGRRLPGHRPPRRSVNRRGVNRRGGNRRRIGSAGTGRRGLSGNAGRRRQPPAPESMIRSELPVIPEGGLRRGADAVSMTITAPLTVDASTTTRRTADVEIVIPVYNEEAELEASIRRLHRYLSTRFPLSWIVTIADNASRDQTWGIACRLAGQLEGVRAVHLDEKGRGRALRATWSASTAAVVAYMDVDLSTDLDALLPLVAPLLSGHSDVAIGSRLAAGARVVRGPKREVISRSYNLLLRATLHNGFSDAQCGFKAVRGDVAHALLPLIEDDGWFFDTELLVLAEHNGLRIHEVPVDWVDDPDSRVDVASTARDDLKGIWRHGAAPLCASGEGDIPPGAMPAIDLT